MPQSSSASSSASSSQEETLIQAYNNAYSLVHRAIEAEIFSGDYHTAHNLLRQAISAFEHCIRVGHKKSNERRRAKLQLSTCIERVNLLGSYMHSVVEAKEFHEAEPSPPPPLPSPFTINHEFGNSPGIVFLSMVERKLWTNLPAHRHLPPPSAHTRNPIYLTPLLSPTLPPTTYHIHSETSTRFKGLSWHNLHVKDPIYHQTLYTMSFSTPYDSHKPTSVPQCTMYRGCAYDNICARVTFDLPSGTGSPIRVFPVCPMKIESSGGTMIMDEPDHQGVGSGSKGKGNRAPASWTPRRFTYGNRRFVWRSNTPDIPRRNAPASASNSTTSHSSASASTRSKRSTESVIKMLFSTGSVPIGEELYEIQREHGGERGDEVFEKRLVWGETRAFGPGPAYTVHMVGGLDQLFREYLLASMMATKLIKAFRDRQDKSAIE
ncbi:hypothetical protein BDN72DRAFT_484723 [Pluteus cervinus]|uniref:Uncharacterized protein n=1 Tax=Pluteus cervinus TaxID=181527 RepID=A0ACD3A5W9_9AGAR|nr:hypothetical protein BDN72DRAFT_484723 [Pluteus cervinus]